MEGTGPGLAVSGLKSLTTTSACCFMTQFPHLHNGGTWWNDSEGHELMPAECSEQRLHLPGAHEGELSACTPVQG